MNANLRTRSAGIQRHRPAAALLGHPLALARVAGAAVLALLCAGSHAQDSAGWKLQCQFVGNSGEPEPLGDREGHAISVSEYTCRTEGGPLDGAVMTGHAIWEWDKGQGQLRAGDGIYRKSGAMLVHGPGEGKLSLTMADGKVSGWTITGRGSYAVATGSAATLAGKTWTAAARSTGAKQFSVDVKLE